MKVFMKLEIDKNQSTKNPTDCQTGCRMRVSVYIDTAKGVMHEGNMTALNQTQYSLITLLNQLYVRNNDHMKKDIKTII